MDNTNLTIELTDPAGQESMACIAAYYAELEKRLDSGFDPKKSVSAEPSEMTPPAGYFFIARLDNKVVACAGIKIKSDYAEIKRMWVNPNARGHGIGGKLILALENQAIKCGINTIRLDTHHDLKEATKLYMKSGYAKIEPYNNNPYADHWFEKKLTLSYG